MKTDCSLGPINGHIVGRVLKEAVRRAMVAIRNERAIFETQVKADYWGQMEDVCTSADKKAQDIYLRTLRECFPACGVVAEEDSLRIEPSDGCTAYFTVDPLDGTKAYVRRQSHVVGTMIALIDGGSVISAYIGDINTEEIYGYRPGTTNCYRITRMDTFEQVKWHSPLSKMNNYVLLRDPLERYSPATRDLVTGCFKSYLIDGGSIGTWLARLWKREVAAAVISPSWVTPWDTAPLVGISLKLGYLFLRPGAKGRWEPATPRLERDKYHDDHDMLIVHRDDFAALT